VDVPTSTVSLFPGNRFHNLRSLILLTRPLASATPIDGIDIPFHKMTET
jgi:hypothetical protein